MAKNNQTFKAVLKLQAEQFKKEAASVKKTLGSLQKTFMSFAAWLGAGLGFAQLISTMRKTSLELSTARATLENVSRETKTFTDGINTASVALDNYGENLDYVTGLAKKYKQDIITLTDSFAKFSAAATTANVSMQDQRDIFEALTRAATFYHMSGERTQQMMVAIEQMFSKGRVSAEELRRQLGNNLPGAFGIMAKAIGVTNAELDKMLRNGEVLASDALPKFAKELNKLTGNINLDSVQLAQTELKNAWVGFVDASGFENLYKKILNLTSKLLNTITNNLSTIKGAIGGLFLSLTSNKAWNFALKKWGEYRKGVERELSHIQAKYNQAQRSFVSGFKGNHNAGLRAMPNVGTDEFNALNPSQQEALLGFYKEQEGELKKIQELTSKLGKNTTKLGRAWQGLVFYAKQLGAALKGIASAALWTIAITVITTIVTRLIELHKEAKEIKKIVDNFDKGLENITTQTTTEAREIDNLIGVLERLNRDGQQGTQEWLNIISQLNGMMNLVGDAELSAADNIDKIKAKAAEWCELQKDILRYQYAINEELDAEKRMSEIRNERSTLNRTWHPKQAKNLDLEMTYQDERRNKAIAEQKKYINIIQQKANATTGSTVTGDTKPSDFVKTVQKQKEAIKELENQYKAGAFSADEYRKKQSDLIVSTFEAVTAFDNFSSQLKSMGEANWFDNIARQFALIKFELGDSIDEIEEYDRAMSDLGDTLYESFKENQNNKYSWSKTPERGYRNTTFDYKKSQSSILGEELDLTKAQLDYVTDAIEEAREKAKEGITEAAIDLANLQNQLKSLQKEVVELNDKMVLAQLQEDIANYQQQMFDGIASGIKSTATAMDRLVSSTQTMMDTLQNPDASAWEHIMSIFNEIVQVFDTVTGLIELFNTLSTISNALGEAKSALLAKQNIQREQELGLVGALSTAEVAEGVAASQASLSKAAANKINSAALTSAAFAAGAANSMELPFPYNLAALASNQAAIAQMIMMGKMLGAFANGGIVGGNSTTGDKNFIRANSGEMVLTKGQQGTLFSLLNGKGKLGGGEVQFKIKGDALVGVLNNYRQKIKG